jgi:phage regulator Rha-like protein
MTDIITVQPNSAGELVVDSRLVAEELGVQHKNLLETIKRHQVQLEQALGAVNFKCREFTTQQGNRSVERFALLDEGQAAFILTCSRNTPRVVRAKLFISKEFLKARQLLQASKSIQDFMDAAPGDEGIKSMGGGFVYLIQAKTTNYCKIGVSSKPFQRLTTLQTGSPLELIIVERIFSTEPFKLEAALHRHYSQQWVRGEWYDLPKSEIDLFVVSANRIDSQIEQLALSEAKLAA